MKSLASAKATLNKLIKAKTNIVPEVLDNFLPENKGRYGLFIEKILGFTPNNRPESDHPSYEIKTVSTTVSKKTNLTRVCGTVAIGMHTGTVSISNFNFMKKNARTLFVFLDKSKESLGIVTIKAIAVVDLAVKKGVKKVIENDLSSISKCNPFSSTVGTFVQSRTKGSGSSTKKSRALYYKTKYLNLILNFTGVAL